MATGFLLLRHLKALRVHYSVQGQWLPSVLRYVSKVDAKKIQHILSHGSHKPIKCRGQESSPWLQKNHTLKCSYAQVISCRGREMHAVTLATGPWLTCVRLTISRLTFCKTLTDTSIKSFATRLVISLEGGTGIASPPYSSCSISTRWGMKNLLL